MKAAVYSPYFSTLGGGERYAASVVSFLLMRKYQVDIFSETIDFNKLHARFNLDIKAASVNVKAGKLFSHPGSLFKKYQLSQEYDVFFYVSDGSVPFLSAQKNLLLFQAPFHNVGGRSLFNQLKLRRIRSVVCYSNFVKQTIDNEFNINSRVLAPAVSLFKAGKKQKVILSVARFDNLLNSKRQDVLIKAFKLLKQPDWKLVLAGGNVHGDKYVKKLKKQASGLSVAIKPNLGFAELTKLYATASIFWHAAGYEVDPSQHPERAEHFGISIIEAMSAGAVPFVYNAGGPAEIVSDGQDGYHWSTINGLVAKTKLCIKRPDQKIAKAAQRRAGDFTTQKFYEGLKKIIS